MEVHKVSKDSIRVEDSGLYFILIFILISIFFYLFFILNLGLEINITSQTIIHWLHVAQKNKEGSRTIILFHMLMVHNIYSLYNRLGLV